MNKKQISTCCPGKLELKMRSLISVAQAQNLEKIFKTLSNNTRIRILHAFVKNSELCVTEIARMLDMKSTAVSNQLQKLTDQGIVKNRRDGNRIIYRILDPCIIKLLDSAWCLDEDINCKILENDTKK